MLSHERERLGKERYLADLEVKRDQLTFYLDRLASIQMQATLVTGFAFGVLGPDVIEALPFFDAPVITYVYNMSATMSMLCSTGAVVMSSILMWEVNRLSLYGSVSAAVVAARRHEIAVIGIYLASLALLTVCVCFGFLATCEAVGVAHGAGCHRAGYSVMLLVITTVGFFGWMARRMHLKFRGYSQGPAVKAAPVHLDVESAGIDTGLRHSLLAPLSQHAKVSQM